LSTNIQQREVVFNHLVMEGDSYRIGMMQGQMLRRNRERYPFLTSLPPGAKKPSKHEVRDAMKFFDNYYPGINDEIRGVADELCLPVDSMSYYVFGYSTKSPKSSSFGKCSQFAVNPSASRDGHPYVGCSYDLHPDYNELRLCTTRVRGQARHIGFSEDLFGRADGINEHGLCVTTTSTVGGGFEYHAVVRTILDRCKTVDDALEVINGIPTSHCHNYIIADEHGNAALIELAHSRMSLKRLEPSSSEMLLISTNHYTLPNMLRYDTNRMLQSAIRYEAIKSHLESAIPRISRKVIRDLLSEPMPRGICCHHYEDFLGTLWAMIFDLNEQSVEICFGAPSRNEWKQFGLSDPVGHTEYVATLPYEPANPEIWRKLHQGEDVSARDLKLFRKKI
jgi:predicted choloylglycine hydrolase